MGDLLDLIGDAVVASGADLRITLWNHAAETLYGWTAEEAIGQIGVELLRSEYTVTTREELFRSLEESGEWRGEITHHRKDGAPVVIQATSRLLRDTNGEIAGYLSVNRDVTQQQRAEGALRDSEARFAEAQRIAHLGSWEWDLEATHLWSEEMCRILGVEPGGFGGDYEDFLMFVHPDDRNTVDRAVKASLSEHAPYDVEVRFVRPDGSERWLHSRALLVTDATGRPVRMVGTALDVTERRQAEEKRRLLLASLVAAQEEERARIAADIHDDSIQSMTAVGMRLETLTQLASEQERTEALRKLKDAVSASINRLRHLLFELRPSVLDEEGLAPALDTYLERMEEETGIEAHLDNRLVKEPSVETRVILYRIAQEALANVAKHARAAHVAVTLVSRDEGILVRIKDDGVGFDPDAVESAPTATMGLAAMRERAEMAGGWHRIHSSSGSGTLVEFWVPEKA